MVNKRKTAQHTTNCIRFDSMTSMETLSSYSKRTENEKTAKNIGQEYNIKTSMAKMSFAAFLVADSRIHRMYSVDRLLFSPVEEKISQHRPEKELSGMLQGTTLKIGLLIANNDNRCYNLSGTSTCLSSMWSGCITAIK